MDNFIIGTGASLCKFFPKRTSKTEKGMRYVQVMVGLEDIRLTEDSVEFILRIPEYIILEFLECF